MCNKGLALRCMMCNASDMQKNLTFTSYLEKAGLGQNEFARRHNIDPTLLSRYVTKAVKIPLPMAVKIEQATKRAVPVASWVRNDQTQPIGESHG